MILNFVDIKTQLDKLIKEVEQVVEKYDKARWEDEVKASHISFISQCKETETEINSIKCGLDEAEQLAGKAEESSNVKHNLDDIRSQTDSIVV